MDWETYYDKFYDWATSTQISRMSSLTSFGPSSEVAEVAQNLMDEKAASRLIRKAISAGVQFTAEEISELSGCCDTAAMNALLRSADCAFTQEQLEDLWGAVDDEVLALAAKRSRVALFDEEDSAEEDEEDSPEPAAPRLGFFAKLGLALGLSGALRGNNRPQRGHCTGNCASCPPHYGYRYGRWYYGHHHTHGCELGGNSGSGG